MTLTSLATGKRTRTLNRLNLLRLDPLDVSQTNPCPSWKWLPLEQVIFLAPISNFHNYGRKGILPTYVGIIVNHYKDPLLNKQYDSWIMGERGNVADVFFPFSKGGKMDFSAPGLVQTIQGPVYCTVYPDFGCWHICNTHLGTPKASNGMRSEQLSCT